MLSVKQRSCEYQCLSHWFDPTRNQTRVYSSRDRRSIPLGHLSCSRITNVTCITNAWKICQIFYIWFTSVQGGKLHAVLSPCATTATYQLLLPHVSYKTGLSNLFGVAGHFRMKKFIAGRKRFYHT